MNQSTKPFPSILQSFGITGFVVLLTLMLIPLQLSLNELLPPAAATLIFYSMVLLIPILIFHQLKKKVEGLVTYQFLPRSWSLTGLIILASLSINHGIIIPLGSLIPMPDIIKESFLELLLQVKSIYGFITIAVAAPILEEILFRGIILNGLLKRYSPQKAILVSAFLFGIVHLNPWQFFGAFLIGIFMGYVYYHTKNIGYCILIHFSGNFTAALSVFFLSKKAMISDKLSVTYGGELNFYLIFGFSLLLIPISFLALHRRLKRQGKNQLETSNET